MSARRQPQTRLAVASLLGCALHAWGGLPAGESRAFLDEAHCLDEERTAIHQVLFRSAPGEPLAGLHFLLLRPLPFHTARGSAAADTSVFEVVFSNPLFGSGFPGQLCIEEVGSPRRPCVHVTRPEAVVRMSRQARVPPDSAFRLYFEDALEGRPGDCLGWLLEGGATGDVSWGAGPGLVRTASLAGGAESELLGRHLSFAAGGAAQGPRARWLTSRALRAMTDMPRAARLRASRDFVQASPDVHLTSTRFKTDLIRLLAKPAWGATAALEIGSNMGQTTQVLAQLFRMVFALDSFTSQRLRARLSGHVDNLIYWHVDSKAPYAFRKLAAGNISFVFIDGDHSEYSVVHDTFAALQDIACCVRLVAYHDYCLNDVYYAVQRFVSRGVLRFLAPLGWRQPGARFVPCDGESANGDRPEGALFEVVHGGGENPFQTDVELARLDFQGLGSLHLDAVAASLQNSSWLLLHFGLHALLRFQLWPESSQLYLCSSSGCSGRSQRVGGLRIMGWVMDRGSPFGPTFLRASLHMGQEEEPQAVINFDRYMEGFAMSAHDGPLLGGLPQSVIGQKNSKSGMEASFTDINTWASGAMEG